MFVFFVITIHYSTFLYSSVHIIMWWGRVYCNSRNGWAISTASHYQSMECWRSLIIIILHIHILFVILYIIKLLPEYWVLEVTPHHPHNHRHQTRNEKEPLKWNYFHNILFPLCSSNSKPFALRYESTSVLRAFTWKSFPREMSFHLIPMVIAIKCHHYTSYLSFFIQRQFQATNFTFESA